MIGLFQWMINYAKPNFFTLILCSWGCCMISIGQTSNQLESVAFTITIHTNVYVLTHKTEYLYFVPSNLVSLRPWARLMAKTFA